MGKLPIFVSNYNNYFLLSFDENNAYALKNNERLGQLEASYLLFQEYETQLKELKEEQNKNLEWENYLACDGLPRTHIPAEIRDFLAKIHMFETDSYNSFSWTLSTDERSILTQDIDAVNNTREHLKKTKRIDWGELYDKFISQLKLVYNRLLITLDTKLKVKTDLQYKEIKKLKTVLQCNLKELYDKLTYRILSNENANIDPISVTSAQYKYQCKLFSLDIWTFQNVPINMSLEEMPSFKVKLETIQTTVTLPFAVLCPNLVLRGLFISYDHYSEFSGTCKINDQSKPEEQDLRKKLRAEWKERLAIQKNIKEKMIAERAAYEEHAILKEAEDKAAAAAAGGKAGAKTKKPKKESSLPPIVGPKDFPDIEEDFLKFIELDYIKMQNQFAPELLNLDPDEINLREYGILGGIYELNFVYKTEQVIISNVIMQWFEKPQNLRYIDKNIEETKPDAEEVAKVQKASKRFSKMGPINEEKRFVQFFELVFKIPEHITKWSQPLACQYLFGTDLIDIQEELLQNTGTSKPVISLTVPIVLNDFNISGYLSNEQIYKIVLNALPRTLSSYQMTEELIETKKGGGGGLKKFKTVEANEDLQNDVNESGTKKELPERLFPKYAKVQPIIILDLSKIIDEDKYFKDLINDFQLYKHKRAPIFIKKPYPARRLKKLIEAEKRDRIKRSADFNALFAKIEKPKKPEKPKKNQKNKEEIQPRDPSITQMPEILSDNIEIPEKELSKQMSAEEIQNQNRKTLVLGSLRANNIWEFEENKTKWSTKHIFRTQFNQQRSELTLITDRLGIFAFMFPKFIHFPYKMWTLNPDPENPKENVIFYVETKQAKFTFKITPQGYLVDIRNYGIGSKTLEIYYKNEKPVVDLPGLIQELRTKNLNIFPDPDSFAYIKGRLQQKLISLEYHNYNCMAIYSLFLKYSCSAWNWISDPRILIFKAGELKDRDEDYSLIKITPEESSFVEIKELCSTDIQNIILEYTPTWKNIEYNADFLSLVTTSYSSAYNNRIKNGITYYYVHQILKAIRPLSSC